MATSAAWTAPSGVEEFAAPEQHFALVAEVPEEGALGQAGAFGDLRDRGLVVAALDEQVHRGFFKASSGVRRPTAHGSMVDDDSD
jgi:hypothetical protein